MKKKYFTAKAALVDNEGKEFEVTIYSLYESREEAEQGVARFLARSRNVTVTKVVKTWIEG